MAVQARENIVAQQRLDLSILSAIESFTAADFRSIVKAFTGLDKAYILSGLQVTATSGLTISIKVANSQVFNPLDSSGSFLLSPSDATDIIVDLPASQSNIFVEASFINMSKAPITASQWDPLAQNGDSPAGFEFQASINSQNIIVMRITANTVGPTPNAIPIAVISTDASKVTNMKDARNGMFRLATGGVNADAGNNFPFSATRGESVGSGTGVGDAADSPFREKDGTGILNDKGIHSLKEWMDAVMTRFKEITGSTLWYSSSILSNYLSNLTVDNSFFFSDAGHSINPSNQTSLIWSRNNDNRLRSHGVSPVEWQANYADIRWHLGGTFTAGTRAYSEPKFVSPQVGGGPASTAPVNNGNIYLNLEKDVVKGSGSPVSWGNAGTSPYSANLSVTGIAGDFTGVAIGDYIRKNSEGLRQYYKVLALWNNSASVTTVGTIADNTIITVQLSRIIPTTSTETFRYFRSNYSNADIFSDTQTDQPYGQDVNQYWMGRRVGTLFILRGYGNMTPGEETYVQNDATQTAFSESASQLILEHSLGASYDAASGYKLKSGSGTLLTILKRKKDNTVGDPKDGNTQTPFDNTNGWLTYTLTSPWSVSSIATGRGLWVRLSDSSGGALTAGQVASYDQTSTSDDDDNIDPTPANRYEDRPVTENVLNSFDDRDVFLLARRITISGTEALLFFDGSILTGFGEWLNNSQQVQGDQRLMADLYLSNKTAGSIPFIAQTSTPVGLVSEDNANFFYNSATPQFGFLNFRATAQSLDTNSAADVSFLSSIGAGIITIGGSASATHFPGDIVISGDIFEASFANHRILASIGNAITELAAIAPGKVLISDSNGLPIAGTANYLTDVSANQDAARLFNKDFDAVTTLFDDSTDPTKKARFDISAITTGTTAVFTLPAGGGVLLTSGSVVDLTSNQSIDGVKEFLKGLVTVNTTTASETITVGRTLTIPNLTISTGQTITINSGAFFVGVNTVTINGTMIINGSGRIL